MREPAQRERMKDAGRSLSKSLEPKDFRGEFTFFPLFTSSAFSTQLTYPFSKIHLHPVPVADFQSLCA